VFGHLLILHRRPWAGQTRASRQTGSMPEEQLAGGYASVVTRIGDTVRRTRPADDAFVRALLGLFEQCGWPGAPRYLGLDEQGRQVISYLAGHVAWAENQPRGVWSAASLIRAAVLVREFHDLTAGTELAAGHEVVCHNDLSPRNTVYRDDGSGLRPVAFIDWDLAAPGARVHDLAHVCWQFLTLGPDIADAAEAGRNMRLICDSYGLDDRTGLVETILWSQDRCWRGILRLAQEGDPAMIRLRDRGGAQRVLDDYRWVAGHRRALAASLG
jgi:hypothetical protein